jgi:hypothetical protein
MSLASESSETQSELVEASGSWTFRPSKNVRRVGQATGRILHDPAFWITIAGLATVIGVGCLPRAQPYRRLLISLLGLMALAELGWHGFAVVRVAPLESFFKPDPACEALLLMDPNRARGQPLRVRARDTFFLDLQAALYEIEKTNINDVFQLARAASLFETLYPVATRTTQAPETPMSLAVDDDRRQIRQGVFDRMAVSYLVSDRVEPDPDWPIAAIGNRHGGTFVIQRNPSALPRAYVVPRAEIVSDDAAMILSRFRSSDPRVSVLMNHDPLERFADVQRQPFTPVHWNSLDPDRPVLEVTTEAPGLLVMTDTWMPGWNAQVDDQRVRIRRGNFSQRVIPLEKAGRHTIVLTYNPPGFGLGCAVTVVSAFIWASVCGLLVWRRSSPRSTGDHSVSSAGRKMIRRSGGPSMRDRTSESVISSS